jgi:hypothetical protein
VAFLRLPKFIRMLLFSVMFSLLVVAMLCLPVSASQSDAATAISSAQNTLSSCFDAAKAAEAAGANITSLTDTINQAGLLLSKAEVAYSQNNFDTAADFAAQSKNILNNFVQQAESLGQRAAEQQNRDFLINVVGSVVGAFAVLAVGFAVWVILGRRNETVGVRSIESSRV